jgi:hypothetical protein
MQLDTDNAAHQTSDHQLLELGNWQESMHHKEHTHTHKYRHILPVKFQRAIEMVIHDAFNSSTNMKIA